MASSVDPSVPSPRNAPGAPGPTTTELLRAAHAGDQEAWNEIVDRYGNLLWAVARAHRLSTADAADVVQATWLRLVEHLGRLEHPERLAGWLTTTARRECLRALRRAGREPLGDADDVATTAGATGEAGGEAVDTRLLASERDRVLLDCLYRLPERCQLLLRVLSHTPPPAYAEVSAALGMPVGSIGPIRGRCLQRLRRLVEEAGLDPTSLQA